MKTIPLTQGKLTIVNDEDFECLKDFSWFATKKKLKNGQMIWYACRQLPRVNGKQQMSQMHREIVNASKGVQVDHKNSNGLDNQRINIRVATVAQNQQNRRKGPNCSSRFKGVTWNKKLQKWQAAIRFSGRSVHLGLFEQEADAASSYRQAAKREFGEFAHA